MNKILLVAILIILSSFLGLIIKLFNLSNGSSILIIMLSVLIIIFWLYILIIAIRSHNKDKVFWVVIILIFNFFGAIAYLIDGDKGK